MSPIQLVMLFMYWADLVLSVAPPCPSRVRVWGGAGVALAPRCHLRVGVCAGGCGSPERL